MLSVGPVIASVRGCPTLWAQWPMGPWGRYFRMRGNGRVIEILDIISRSWWGFNEKFVEFSYGNGRARFFQM